MNILRKLLVGLCATILSIGLFGMAWSNVGGSTIRNKETIKSWFDESGFYTKAVDLILEKIEQPPEGQEQEVDIPVNDPEIQRIAKEAFSPEFLKTNVEAFLDSGYGWLEGNSENLNFSLDLSSAKQQLATGIGGYVTTKAAALPVCATNEPSDNFDAFNAVCRPRGLSAEAAGQQATNDLLNGDQFLKNPVLTTNDLKVKDDSGQEIAFDNSDQARALKDGYQAAGSALILFAIISLIGVAGIIFISRDKLAGVRRAGYTVLVTGVVLLGTYIILGVISNIIRTRLTENTDETVAQEQLIVDAVRVVTSDIKGALLLFVVGYIVLGLLAIIIPGVLKKKKTELERPSSEDKIEDKKEPEENKPAEKTEAKPEPKPQKKIQL